MDYTRLIRENRPVVQCITNIVTVNDCANALLAIGASPTMAHHPLEMAEVQAGCDALVCNLGATENFDAMSEAAKQAFESGNPFVIDPVGCGGSSFRRKFFNQLIKLCKPTCIRGNYAEIAALAKDTTTVTGVDAAGFHEAVNAIEGLAQKLSEVTGAIVVASGIEDIIAFEGRTVRVSGGDIMMSRITGTGCMVSSMLGAYLSQEVSVESVVSGLERMKKAGEDAAAMTRERGAGNMTFREKLIDRLYIE